MDNFNFLDSTSESAFDELITTVNPESETKIQEPEKPKLEDFKKSVPDKKVVKQKEEEEVIDEEDLEDEEIDEKLQEQSKSDEIEEEDEDPVKIFASHLAEKGFIEFDSKDFEDKEFSDSDLWDAFDKKVEERVNEKLAPFLTEETKELIEFLKSGGSAREYLEVNSEDDFSSYSDEVIEKDEELQKYIVARDLFESGRADETEEVLKEFESSGLLEKMAKRAQRRLAKLQETKKVSLIESQKEKQEKAKKDYERAIQDLKKDIDATSEIGGFDISKTEKDKLFKFITEVDRRTGKTPRQIKEQEANRKGWLLYNYLMMNDFSLDNLKRKIKTESTKEFKDKLKNNKKLKGTTKNTPNKKQSDKSDFDRFVEGL